MSEESDLSSLINYDADEGIVIALMKTFSTIEVPGIVDDINNFIEYQISNRWRLSCHINCENYQPR